jgi:hypothetical protein
MSPMESFDVRLQALERRATEDREEFRKRQEEAREERKEMVRANDDRAKSMHTKLDKLDDMLALSMAQVTALIARLDERDRNQSRQDTGAIDCPASTRKTKDDAVLGVFQSKAGIGLVGLLIGTILTLAGGKFAVGMIAEIGQFLVGLGAP